MCFHENYYFQNTPLIKNTRFKTFGGCMLGDSDT